MTRPAVHLLGIVWLVLCATSTNATELGNGEQFPKLQIEDGQLALYFYDSRTPDVPIYRVAVDQNGRLIGNREHRTSVPAFSRWRYSQERRTIDEITPVGSPRRYQVGGPLDRLDRVIEVGNSLIGISEGPMKPTSRDATRDLFFASIRKSTGAVQRVLVGRVVDWSEPDASEIVVINGAAYVAWMRALPVTREEALARSQGVSSLIADLVLSRWVPGSGQVRHAVIARDTPGLAHLSIAQRNGRIWIAADNEAHVDFLNHTAISKIRVRVVMLAELRFS